MYLQTGLILISIFPVDITSYKLIIDPGHFTVTSTEVSFIQTVSLDTGIFSAGVGNLGVYGACGQGNIVDLLASDAPYPPPDFFVPDISVKPGVVLSPDEMFGPTSTDPGSIVYMSYYDSLTEIWNDQAFTSEYPGQTISTDLKERVADQTYLYKQYIFNLSTWQDNYDRQKIFQWPYYWAQNVAIAPGSTPGGPENCSCGSSSIDLSPNTITPASQTVLGGTGISYNDQFDIGGTRYTFGQIMAMVLKNLAQP